jgi:hypothetical protein
MREVDAEHFWSKKGVTAIGLLSVSVVEYADDVSLLGNNRDAITENTGTLTDAGKEVRLDANVEKPKYMLKNVVFGDVTPCCSSKNRRFGGT